MHWLVAWTKPLLVFYNHNASVVRLSLNIYREMDFDRATHLTNLVIKTRSLKFQLKSSFQFSAFSRYKNIILDIRLRKNQLE